MRSIIKAEVSQHTLKLQQLGAKVNVINSTLCYVNFDVCRKNEAVSTSA